MTTEHTFDQSNKNWLTPVFKVTNTHTTSIPTVTSIYGASSLDSYLNKATKVAVADALEPPVTYVKFVQQTIIAASKTYTPRQVS